MRTIVVSGALANKPFNGGEAWVRLSWVRGFRRLGFRVVLVEQIEPGACVDDSGALAPFGKSVNRAYFNSVVEWAGLGGSAALLCGDEKSCEGVGWRELLDVAASAGYRPRGPGEGMARPCSRVSARRYGAGPRRSGDHS